MTTTPTFAANSRFVLPVDPVTGVGYGVKQTDFKPHINAEISNSSGQTVELITNTETGELELPISLRGHICSDNSSNTPLSIDGVFTGAWQDTLDYGTVTIGIKTDKDSAVNGLCICWSADGEVEDDNDTFSIKANMGKVFTFGPARRYVKVVYTNGGVAQTSFHLQTILRRVYIKDSSHRINDSIVAEDDATLVKAVLTGENPAGVFINFQSTTQGNFKVSLEEFENNVSVDSNTTLKVAPYIIDEFDAVARVLGDNIFQGCLLTIPVEHHEIHCGDSYETTFVNDMPNGGTTGILITVPNELGSGQSQKLFHLKGLIESESESTVEFFEAPTITSNGTAITVFNRNRNSTLTDFLSIFHTPTISANGTRIFWKKLGSSNKFGGTAERADEFILKNNTSYLLKITNDIATNNYCNVELNYYVHPGV